VSIETTPAPAAVAPAASTADTNLILKAIVGLGAVLTIVWLALTAGAVVLTHDSGSESLGGSYFDGTTWQWMILLVVAILTILAVALAFVQKTAQMNRAAAGLGALSGVAGIVAFLVAPGLASSAAVSTASAESGIDMTWEMLQMGAAMQGGELSTEHGIGAWLMLVTGIVLLAVSGFWLFKQLGDDKA